MSKKVILDNGTQFRSRKWRVALENMLGIQVRYTSVYHPSVNLTEGVMRELRRLFRVFCHENRNSGVGKVVEIEHLLNNVHHESTGYTPIELIKAQQPESQLTKLVNFPPQVNTDLVVKFQRVSKR
ncbi:hypothetical protein PR048_011822 [Dryococelus australis]|uniref:Integrase catalytic domain-containing protein n=1 Tax=Dryococelus australis TaxID=614101 RepID=A0ABQ9HNB3_9NEOP|nr:hypothetical protein PR048_011822 [Dryococelus australis]